ncbi:3-deoxy-7-phosphoheptulonate synthase [Micromonospora sp. C95]|nr:3-deoxy-7-phosphoheptulonate synthase [Micromonospora sp. C95]
MQPPSATAEFVQTWPWEGMPATQQPDWRNHTDHHEACTSLAKSEPLVTSAEINSLRTSLSALPGGDALLLQAGDCAESFYESSGPHIAEKLRVLDKVAEHLGDCTSSRVVCIGRMGGQFAKPRSRATEQHGDGSIPAFRGHMVNSEIATLSHRQANPSRMLWAYDASERAQRAMRDHRRRQRLAPTVEGPWSSHEALIIDYETRLVRRAVATGEPYLASTHVPWVGDRTRQPDGAHVALLRTVTNPVGCKIGPSATPDEVARLCDLLDPRREPGRLILIPRMGRAEIRKVLPPIVRRVSSSGHPVIWLSDPMHGNTRMSHRLGLKTRHLTDMITEALMFRDIVEANNQRAGGLHLELAAGDVTECIGGSVRSEDDLLRHYTSLCDPRLNLEQAVDLVEAWAKGVASR